jgi:hypothetical protein
MKKTVIVTVLFYSVLFCGITSCKREKIIDKTCGCNAVDIRFNVKNISGTMAYNNTARKWYIGFQPSPGYFNNNFICNANKDCVKSITMNVSTLETIDVTFSGTVKSTCSNEDFGVQQSNGTNFHIIIDSLKRN